MTEHKMVGCHHRLNGHEFEQALGVGDGQGSLACYSPWGSKKLNTTELLNSTEYSTHSVPLSLILFMGTLQSLVPPPRPPHPAVSQRLEG